ncbi:MAG: HAD hydrolase family protein [Lachnospiraceae bacterium]|nr:HAD hydrolase family protein [Lachnospiraceae bacterium]
MSIFFTDLDNTMIYSHHRGIDKPKIVVEHLNGREQSFMTQFTYDFLCSANWLTIVPVSTRTEHQYRRIECVERLRFKYAIVCNGGKLLIDGKEDKEWSLQTDVLADESYDSLEHATELLAQLLPAEVIHRPEKYMSYAKCDDPESVYEKLRDIIDLNKVNVQRDGRKVYIFANGISKGKAIERFKQKTGFENIIVAGDNFMDVSMLNKADYAFVHKDIYNKVECRNKHVIGEDLMSDEICEYLKKMKIEGII